MREVALTIRADALEETPRAADRVPATTLWIVEGDELLGFLAERVFPYAVREPHPGFVAYVPGAPTFPAVLGDWLATGHNFFAGVWPVAEGPNAVELAVLEWFRAWVGMPAGTGGLLTNGGSGATY